VRLNHPLLYNLQRYVPSVAFKWDSRAGPVILISLYEKRIGFAIFCHRRSNRCITIHGHRSFLCARCTGICVGAIISISLAILKLDLSPILGFAFVLPLLVDGFSQLLGFRESNNMIRFITGMLFAAGFFALMPRVM